MPNHCDQTVTITGPRAMIEQLHDGLKATEARFCDLISPMPFEMWAAPEIKLPDPWDTMVPAWREWRDEHWGTKWDVCGVENVHLETLISLTFQCWTAWAPPIPIWDRLVDLGCKVSAEYRDEGDMFEGTYENGLDQCWEPTALDSERWEIDEDMNLDKDVYEEDV